MIKYIASIGIWEAGVKYEENWCCDFITRVCQANDTLQILTWFVRGVIGMNYCATAVCIRMH